MMFRKDFKTNGPIYSRSCLLKLVLFYNGVIDLFSLAASEKLICLCFMGGEGGGVCESGN